MNLVSYSEKCRLTDFTSNNKKKINKILRKFFDTPLNVYIVNINQTVIESFIIYTYTDINLTYRFPFLHK